MGPSSIEGLLVGLYPLWIDGELLDCELATSDGDRVGAHRVVLAAASGFFRVLFTGAWGQQQQAQQPHALPCWALSGVDGPSLRLLLHAVYSRRLPLTGASADGGGEEVAALLAASNYLDVLPVKEACCAHLRARLSLGTVARTLALAAAHDCADLLADAARFFRGHFASILRDGEAAASLALLPPDLLRELLSSDGLNTTSELAVARATLLWAAPDPRNRAPLLPELLHAARMPPAQLAAEAARAGLLDGPNDACLLLSEQQQQASSHSSMAAAVAAAAALQLPSPPAPGTPQHGGGGELGQAFLHACEQLGGPEAAVVAYRPRLSCATGLMMAGGLDDGWRPLRTVELYDPQKDEWSGGPLMPAPCSFAAAAMLGEHTYVVEGAAHAPHVLALERQPRRWAQCRGLATPRVNMAVCALEGRLYVLGGRAGIGKGAAVLRDVEVFDPASNAWRSAPPMAQPRTALAAAALGGKLYAVGGQSTRSCYGTVECWEPGAGRWVELGPASAMQQPRKYLGLADAGGRLVAVGGMTGARMRLQAAEAFDPREGRWTALPPMSTPRSSAGVAALHDNVFVVGGNIGFDINENYAGVESYVPSAGRWRTCSPISHGRSGLSVAPF